MKLQNRKTNRNRTAKASLRGMMLQLPREFYRLPDFELRGGYLTTDGCRRVLNFEPEKVCLDMGDFTVTFYGAELRIESYAGKRLVLAGQIETIVFQNKWGKPKHET